MGSSKNKLSIIGLGLNECNIGCQGNMKVI